MKTLHTGRTEQPDVYFKIACIPPKATHQGSMMIMKRRDGSSFVGKAQNSKGAAAKRDLMSLMIEHAPKVPLKGPIELQVEWAYPWRKSETKKRMAEGYQYCDTRPDVDNLMKMLGDCMTRLGFYGDDSQIARLHFTKLWADKPGITVWMWELHGKGGWE